MSRGIGGVSKTSASTSLFWGCSRLHWISHQNVPTMDLSEEEPPPQLSEISSRGFPELPTMFSSSAIQLISFHKKSLPLVFTYNFLVHFSHVYFHFYPLTTENSSLLHWLFPTLTSSQEIGLWIGNDRISSETFSRPPTLRNQGCQLYNLWNSPDILRRISTRLHSN